MARSRRGSFGLQPRVVPNITSTVIALAREYVSQRDSLIMDAWRNGGTFEGKRATDDMVLAYWNERKKDLDPGDPEFENIKNNIMQLQYGIEQSKQDLLHVQGKLTDQQYAQFFLKWAKRVPANSEFYRTLQKDAAGLIEASKAKARASADRAKTEAFNHFVKTTTENDIAIGDAMTKALNDLSKATGLSVTGNGDELLALLTQNVKANPDQYRMLLDTINKADPNWDGQLTEGYFTQHIKSAVQGYEMIADRAQKAGFVSAYASATDGMAAMSQWGQNVRVWPISQTYTDAMNSALRVWNDPNASEMDKTSAAAKAAAQLQQLAQTPGIDAGSKSMIEADMLRLLGQDGGDSPSFGTSMLGRTGVSPEMTMQLGAYVAKDLEMKTNPLAYAYAPVDRNGQFDPTGLGPLGIVPAGSVQPGAVGVMVPGSDGKAVLAMVSPHSVYVTDPNNPNASPKLAGYQISYNVGGRNIQLWGYTDNNGQPRWRTTSPLSEGSTTTVDNKGDVYVTAAPSALSDPVAKARQIDAQMAAQGVTTHLADQIAAQVQAGSTQIGNVSVTSNALDKDGHITGSVELSYSNGTFTATQKTNTLDKEGRIVSTQSTPISVTAGSPAGNAFSPTALAAGNVPGVTFDSPLSASVTAASYTQTADQVAKFASDPAFQQQFLSQTMQTLGTNNPFDPRIAQAWKTVTTPNAIAEFNAEKAALGDRSLDPRLRAELRYPGDQSQSQSALGSKLTINYGNGQTLQIPGLPSYLQNQQIDSPNMGADAAQRFASNPLGQLLPGLGVNVPTQMPAQPSPAITPTSVATGPGAVPTNVGGVITPTPAPTSAPAPKPYVPPRGGPKPV